MIKQIDITDSVVEKMIADLDRVLSEFLVCAQVFGLRKTELTAASIETMRRHAEEMAVISSRVMLNLSPHQLALQGTRLFGQMPPHEIQEWESNT